MMTLLYSNIQALALNKQNDTHEYIQLHTWIFS